MAAEIIPLRAPQPSRVPSLMELVARVHALAKDSENIGFRNPHLQERMAQRGRTMRQILTTLRKGEGVSGPSLDDYGDWRIKMRRLVAGARVQVVVAVKAKSLAVVTVI